MKTFAVLLAAVGIVSAQDLYQGVPTCATSCIEEYVPKAGCALDDAQCQCNDEFLQKLTPSIATCLSTNCSDDEIQQALDAVYANCALLGGSLSSSLAPTAAPTATTSFTRPHNSTFTTSSFAMSSSSFTSSSPRPTTTSSSGDDDNNNSDGDNNNDSDNSDAPGAGASVAPALGGVAALMLGAIALL